MSDSYLPGLVTGHVHGVAIERNQLDVEVHRLAHLLRSAGVRLQRVFRETDADDGSDVKPLPADHQPLLEWHAKTTRWLLAEQRARAQLRPGTGLEVMSDAQYEAELRSLARDAVLEMADDDLASLLSERDDRRR
jgi:hypothetical protein